MLLRNRNSILENSRALCFVTTYKIIWYFRSFYPVNTNKMFRYSEVCRFLFRAKCFDFPISPFIVYATRYNFFTKQSLRYVLVVLFGFYCWMLLARGRILKIFRRSQSETLYPLMPILDYKI